VVIGDVTGISSDRISKGGSLFQVQGETPPRHDDSCLFNPTL